jgi:hypothetical protein
MMSLEVMGEIFENEYTGCIIREKIYNVCLL